MIEESKILKRKQIILESLKLPANTNEMTNNKKRFIVGRSKLRERNNLVIDDRFVQFGGLVYKQKSGKVIGTTPALYLSAILRS